MAITCKVLTSKGNIKEPTAISTGDRNLLNNNPLKMDPRFEQLFQDKNQAGKAQMS
jgi:hypothetical protein